MIRRQIFVDPAAGEERVLPVPPSGYRWEAGNEIGVAGLDGFGTVHLPGRRTLATQAVECFFPAHTYPFNEPGTSLDPQIYVDWFTKRAKAGTVLRYIVTGTGINVAVLVEDFLFWEQDGTGDVNAKITLREYATPATTILEAATPTAARPAEVASTGTVNHKVAKGETLGALCRRYYGKASTALCQQVAAHNGIKNINLIYPGQVIKFPTVGGLPGPGTASAVTSSSQKAAAGTKVVDGKMKAEQADVAVTILVTGNGDAIGRTVFRYTERNGSKVDRTINGERSAWTVKVPSGSACELRFEQQNGKRSDYRMYNGVKNMTTHLMPTKACTLEIHWVKE